MPKLARRCVAAVDLGSSGVRCLVCDLEGRRLGLAAAPLPVETPPDLAPLGRALDPEQLWRLVGRLMRRALKEAGVRGSDVLAVAAASQREGLALLDGAGVELYLGPNTDLRAVFEGQELDSQNPYERTGHCPSLLFAPAKLLWHQRNAPAVFGRVGAALSLDAWLAWRLSGQTAIPAASACELGLWDLAAGAPLVEAGGVDVGRFQVPPVASGRPLGRVTSAAARATGLGTETLVAAGGPDTQCALLGMGVIGPGQAGVVAGWSAPVQMVTATPRLDAKQRTWAGPHVINDLWVCESNAGEGGGAWRWLSRLMAPGLSDEQAGEVLTREAARSPVGANGVLAFLGPSAADMGAAGPRVGGLVFPLLGDVHRAGRGDIARAALEALAFAVRANLEQAAEVAGVTPAVIAFGGGMAGNPVLRRTVADVLARPVGVPRQSGVTLLGAAVLAAVAAGAYDTVLQAVSTMACPTRTQPPDAVRSLEYEEHYQRWRASAAALDTLASRL